MDAVVYIVNPYGIIRGRNAELWPREDLIALYDEAFVVAPFLIFGATFPEAFLNPRERLRSFLLRGFLG